MRHQGTAEDGEDVMNLEFDADTEGLISEAARVFGGAAPVDRLRDGPAPDTWKALAHAGWTTLGAEIAGGALDLGAAVGIYREAGRRLLVEQYVTSGYLLPALMSQIDGPREELEARLLATPGVLLGDGRRRGYEVGPLEHGFCYGIDDLASDVYRLNRDDSGRLRLEVLDGGERSMARTGDLSIAVGTVVTNGGSWHSVPLTIDDAPLEQLRRNELLLHSAALLGCSEQVLVLTRDHTGGRIQFGVPIGSFQAVKHALADVYAANEVAWSALLCACADEADRGYRSDVARLLTVEAALSAARVGAQFHGGIGFTWESDLHHYLKTVLDGAYRFGSSDEIATRIGWTFLDDAC